MPISRLPNSNGMRPSLYDQQQRLIPPQTHDQSSMSSKAAPRQSSLRPATSRSSVQIYSPTASASRSTLRLQIPTEASANLIHPNSASASRLSIHQHPSPAVSFSTSDISLVHLPSATASTSKLLHPNSAAASKLSLVQPDIIPCKVQKRRRPRWLRWLPDLDEVDDRVLALSVTVTLALMVIIGVPLGALLPPRCIVPLPVNVLIPFYVYPDPGAWDRLCRS
jgi:hypothetical protein